MEDGEKLVSCRPITSKLYSEYRSTRAVCLVRWLKERTLCEAKVKSEIVGGDIDIELLCTACVGGSVETVIIKMIKRREDP